jgi:hypothetical protein
MRGEIAFTVRMCVFKMRTTPMRRNVNVERTEGASGAEAYLDSDI